MGLSTIGTVIGAALMIGSSTHRMWWRWQVARHWTLVEGVVVRMEPWKSEAKADDVHHPVIRVRRPDGETVQFKSLFCANPNPWSVGDTVTARMRGGKVRHDSIGAAFIGYGSLFAVGTFVFMEPRGG